MTVEIVRADENHITEIGILWMEFMRYTQNLDPVFTPRDDMIPVFVEEYLRPAMEAKNGLVLAAVENRRIVGYSYSFITEPSRLQDRPVHGCIHDMFINADYRRKSVGEKMLDEIMKWFHSNGIHRIELDVLLRNRAAAEFWEKQGFADFQRTLYREL